MKLGPGVQKAMLLINILNFYITAEELVLKI